MSETQREPLKPCWKCGGEGSVIFDDDWQMGVVVCADCGARVAMGSEAEAIDVWNDCFGTATGRRGE